MCTEAPPTWRPSRRIGPTPARTRCPSSRDARARRPRDEHGSTRRLPMQGQSFFFITRQTTKMSCISGFDTCTDVSENNKKCSIGATGTVSAPMDRITCNIEHKYDERSKNDVLSSDDTSAGGIKHKELYCPGLWTERDDKTWQCSESHKTQRCSNTAPPPAKKDFIPVINEHKCSCWKPTPGMFGFGNWDPVTKGSASKTAQSWEDSGAYWWDGNWYVLGTSKDSWRGAGDPKEIACDSCNCESQKCEMGKVVQPNYAPPFNQDNNMYPGPNQLIKPCLKKDDPNFRMTEGNKEQCAIDGFHVDGTGEKEGKLSGDCNAACKDRDAGSACGYAGKKKFTWNCVSSPGGMPACFWSSNPASCICSGCENKLTGKWVNTGTIVAGSTKTATTGVTNTHTISDTSSTTIEGSFSGPIKAITAAFKMSHTEAQQISDAIAQNKSTTDTFTISPVYQGMYASDGAFWQWEVCYNEDSPDCPGFCYIVPAEHRFAVTADSSKPPCCTEASVCPLQGNSPCNGGVGQLKHGYCTAFTPVKDSTGKTWTSCWNDNQSLYQFH